MRTLRRLDVRADGDYVYLTFESEGFLYNQVRAITGTLLEIGSGRRPVDDTLTILRSLSRRRAGENAPAHGLCLRRVLYDDEDR